MRAAILKLIYRTSKDIECCKFLLIAKNKEADSLQIGGGSIELKKNSTWLSILW